MHTEKRQEVHQAVLLFLTFSFLTTGALGLAGCSPKKLPAFGAVDELTIVTNLVPTDEAVLLFESIFARPPETAHSESMFTPIVVPATEFARYIRRYEALKNLVLLVDVSRKDGLTKRVQGLLGTAVVGRIEHGQAEYFVFPDVWALGQTMTIVAGAGEERIADVISANKYRLYARVDSMVTENTVKSLYESGEQMSITRDLAVKYGWSLRIPPGFSPAGTDTVEAGKVFKLRAEEPTRLISVYWKPEASGLGNAKTYIELRKRLVSAIYPQDAISPTEVTARLVMFQGRQAIRIEGSWKSETTAAAGPFFSYCFVSGGSLFLLDVTLFAPETHEGAYQRQLEALLLTFRG